MNGLGPADLAVLARRFEGIVRAMQRTLMRTSRSGVVSSGHDCSCAILSADDEMITVADSIPIHLMSGPDVMARTMKAHHAVLRRGDAFLHNSPYHGCSHAADLSVLVPVIDDSGTHRFTMLAKAHQADIGNALPSTYMATARDVYEEGALLFPAVRIQRDFEDVDDIVRMAALRIRAPEQWRGDLRALIGSARLGERAALALGAEFGWDTLASFVAAWLDYAETRMVGAIRRLPGGTASATSRHDPFPGTSAEGVPVTVRVTVDPDAARVAVDLRDNPDCLPSGLNLSEATARSATLIGVFNSIGGDVPPNAGSLRRVEVLLRENCVVGIPRHPTSCSVATTNIADRLANAVQRAFADLGDGSGMAESGAIEGPCGAVISGQDPRRAGRAFVNQLAAGDTCGGASPGADGWLMLGNTCTAGYWNLDSIEVLELKHPILVGERRIEPDSEGPGTFRGAPASRVAWEPVGAPVRALYASDGTINAPAGARGGGSGGAARQWISRGGGVDEPVPAVGDVVLSPGDAIVSVSCGGGGYGPPERRDPDRVRHDVAEGYVSVGRAREVYRVAIAEGGAVDEHATALLRAGRSALSR